MTFREIRVGARFRYDGLEWTKRSSRTATNGQQADRVFDPGTIVEQAAQVVPGFVEDEPPKPPPGIDTGK